MSDFLQFYEEEREALFNFILGRVRDLHAAEDIISEVFLRAIRFEKDGGRVTHVRGLLYRITKNLIIDYYRENQKHTKIVSIHDEKHGEKAFDIPDTLPRADELFDRELTREEIENVLSRLREESREIIVLRYFQQLDISEIAETLEKSEGAVRVQLHRSLQELRDVFGDSEEHIPNGGPR